MRSERAPPADLHNKLDVLQPTLESVAASDSLNGSIFTKSRFECVTGLVFLPPLRVSPAPPVAAGNSFGPPAGAPLADGAPGARGGL